MAYLELLKGPGLFGGAYFRGACVWVVRGLAPVALVLAVALASGCGGNAATPTPAASGQVRGMVVEVVGRSITELDSLRIRDEADKVWTFASDEGFVGFTPSHLREHQLMGASVVVTYVRQGDTLVALDLSD